MTAAAGASPLRTPRWARSLRAWVQALAFVVAFWGLLGSAAAEQGRPAGWNVELATQRVDLGRVSLRYEPHLEPGARYLAERIPQWWQRIESELSTDLDDTLIITYVDHAGRVAEATGMPRWVAGVAHSSTGEIMIARHGPDGAPVDLDALLKHEMAHVALHRATGGAAVPRWFNEGLAETFEHNVDLGRAETLAHMIFGGQVPSLEQLERQFRHAEGEKAAQAYAAARDLVTHLRYADGTGLELRHLLLQLRLGEPFDAAVVTAYGEPLPVLVDAWREGLPARFFWFPLIAGGGLPMAVVVPLMVMAWVRKRRARRAAWARLEREELEFHTSLGLAV